MNNLVGLAECYRYLVYENYKIIMPAFKKSLQLTNLVFYKKPKNYKQVKHLEFKLKMFTMNITTKLILLDSLLQETK